MKISTSVHFHFLIYQKFHAVVYDVPENIVQQNTHKLINHLDSYFYHVIEFGL